VCSICIFFLAKEGKNCSLTPMKPNIYTPMRLKFDKGLRQKFKQAPGTGMMMALIDDEELEGGEPNVFPLVVRLEALPESPANDEPPQGTENLGAERPAWVHSQLTQAYIKRKDDDTYQVHVVKQLVWIEGVRYELQGIYGAEKSGGGTDGTDAGVFQECIICMSEPRDTTVLPCRHMVRPLVILNVWKVVV
jgi:E3 ubiquitin-protein ligase MGRN1